MLMPPHVCLHNSKCVNTCFCKGKAVCIDTDGETDGAELYQHGTCELVQAAVQKQNPLQTSQTQRTLTGILYLSTAVFHHHRSEVTLLSIECSFLWDVRVCETDPQPSAYPLSTRLSQVVSASEGSSVRLHHVLTSLQTPYPLSCFLSLPPTDSASRKQGGAGHGCS